jgi:hypothetical protein
MQHANHKGGAACQGHHGDHLDKSNEQSTDGHSGYASTAIWSFNHSAVHRYTIHHTVEVPHLMTEENKDQKKHRLEQVALIRELADLLELNRDYDVGAEVMVDGNVYWYRFKVSNESLLRRKYRRSDVLRGDEVEGSGQGDTS